MTQRRAFLKHALAAGAFPALSPAFLSAAQALPPGTGQATLEPDPEAFEFWSGFLKYPAAPPRARVPAPGSFELGARGTASGLAREAFFFHHGPQGFRPAMDIPPTDLLAGGDVSVSVNVVAFRPADEDRNTFERLQSAQLRLDLLQQQPIIGILDTMAWTAVAILHPDKDKKLPPIQNLNFDPAATSPKMQNIVLPGGQGSWAVNLYAQRKDGFFSQLVQVLTKEIARFAPVIGLPGITMDALQSFNTFYGAFHTKPEYLFQSSPVSVFATASARSSSGASRGVPLRTGTYVLVPLAHAEQLTDDRLATLELKQGLIVPKNTPSVAVYSAAATTMPAVTYATLDVVVKPMQIPCAGSDKAGK